MFQPGHSIGHDRFLRFPLQQPQPAAWEPEPEPHAGCWPLLTAKTLISRSVFPEPHSGQMIFSLPLMLRTSFSNRLSQL